MVGLLIFALVVLIVCVVLGYIVQLLISVQPWRNVALAIVALIGLLIILQHSGVLAG